MRSGLLSLVLTISTYASSSVAPRWQRLFDGRTLAGWRLMAVHGGRGGVWIVERAQLVGDQDRDHSGGLLATEHKFSDFEIELEFQADYPVDSGLFLRTREDGMGYQITIDYRDGGSVGALYAPAEGGFLVNDPGWRTAYRKTGWNHLRARIEGQPAHIEARLNNLKTVDFRDSRDRYPHEGYIGLQVHGGKGAWGDGNKVRFRNIRLQQISQPAR